MNALFLAEEPMGTAVVKKEHVYRILICVESAKKEKKERAMGI